MREWKYKRQDGKEVWKELEKIMVFGNRDQIFEDWLDVIIYSALALTDAKQNSKTFDELKQRFIDNKLSEKYDAEYIRIVERYKDGESGKRGIDHFLAAYSALCNETLAKDKDILGDIYMEMITFGQNGQFFTPEHITDMMAQISCFDSKSEQDKKVVCDPCCGSGRMLLSAHKQNPDYFLSGCDLDPRCVKMTVLNFLMREMSGDIYWGNSLTAEMNKCYIIRNGWIVLEDNPLTPDSMKPLIEQQIKKAEQAALF